MPIEIKAYKTQNADTMAKTLVVDDGTFKVLLPITEGVKVDVDKAVADNQRIALANDAYIQAMVAKLMGKTTTTKEIDPKAYYTSKADAGAAGDAGAGGKG